MDRINRFLESAQFFNFDRQLPSILFLLMLLALTVIVWKIIAHDRRLPQAGGARQREIARLKQAVFVRAVECLVKQIETWDFKDFTALIAPMVLRNTSFEAQWPAAKRRGLVEKRSMDTREKLENALSQLSEPARKGFIVELLVLGDRWSNFCGFGENFRLACKEAKVDLEQIEVEAKALLESAKNRTRKVAV